MCSLRIEPTTFVLLTQCSTTDPREHYTWFPKELKVNLFSCNIRLQPPLGLTAACIFKRVLIQTYFSAATWLNLWIKLDEKVCNTEPCLSISLTPSLSCTWHLLRPPWTSLFGPSAPLPPLPHSSSSPTYSTGARLAHSPRAPAAAAGGLTQYRGPPAGGEKTFTLKRSNSKLRSHSMLPHYFTNSACIKHALFAV